MGFIYSLNENQWDFRLEIKSYEIVSNEEFLAWKREEKNLGGIRKNSWLSKPID